MPLDVLNGNAFTVASMTAAINRLPRVPRRVLDGLNLFTEIPVRTRTIQIEERNGVLQLIPAGTTKDPATPARKGKRTLRSIDAPQLKLDDTIGVEDLIDLRAFGGQGDSQEAISEVINQTMGQLLNSHAATWEHMAVGAIKGVIEDADGTTDLYSLATLFNITLPTAVDYALGTDTTDVAKLVTETVRTIEDAMGDMTFDRVHCLCGKTFFDALINHPKVQGAFELWQSGEFFRQDNRRGFTWKNVTFEEYHGKVGSVSYIPDKDARFFPVGPGIFERYNAPADYLETVRTPGLPSYAKQWQTDDGRAVHIQTQSNPLFICRYPKTLCRGYIQ